VAPQFELNHLKYFYFTVLEGGVEAAAQRLCVQQPVVSKMLRALEDRFGQSLLRKSGRRKVLTDFGQLVYRHCQVLFHEVDKLDDLRKGSKTLSGPLTFGCSEGVAHEDLAKVIHSLTTTYPQLHPNIYTSTARHLVDMLLQRKIEFGLFFHLPDLPSNLEIYKRVPVRFRLVVASKQKKNAKVIEKFIGSREIDDNSTHRFPTLERMKRDYKHARIVLSSNHLSFHRQLVLQGYGSSILPSYLVQSDLRKGTLHDIYPKVKFVFDLKVVIPRGETLSKAAQEAVEKCQVLFLHTPQNIRGRFGRGSGRGAYAD